MSISITDIFPPYARLSFHVSLVHPSDLSITPAEWTASVGSFFKYLG